MFSDSYRLEKIGSSLSSLNLSWDWFVIEANLALLTGTNCSCHLILPEKYKTLAKEFSPSIVTRGYYIFVSDTLLGSSHYSKPDTYANISELFMVCFLPQFSVSDQAFH